MLVHRPEKIYDKSFFDWLYTGALESARTVVPHARDLIHPRRIVDVGCGRGAWLRAFKEIGVEFIQGLDGDYVDRDTLLIPAESFVSADLAQLTKVPGKYDLAICLEVLEHLSPRSGSNIVTALTEAAPPSFSPRHSPAREEPATLMSNGRNTGDGCLRRVDIGCSIRYVRGFAMIRESRGGTGKTFLCSPPESHFR